MMLEPEGHKRSEEQKGTENNPASSQWDLSYMKIFEETFIPKGHWRQINHSIYFSTEFAHSLNDNDWLKDVTEEVIDETKKAISRLFKDQDTIVELSIFNQNPSKLFPDWEAHIQLFDGDALLPKIATFVSRFSGIDSIGR